MHAFHHRRSGHTSSSHTHTPHWQLNKRRPAHASAGHAFFYLVLFGSEVALLSMLFYAGKTSMWSLWQDTSIILANLFFIFMASSHHTNHLSKRLSADLILAGLSMLFLIGLSAFVSPDTIGQEMLVYAWGCVLLLNALHYYPGKRLKTRRRF